MTPGIGFALPELLDCAKRNQALQFVLANASLVVGWKQAGLSHAGLAAALARLGHPVTAKRASALYVRAKAVADPKEVIEIARSLNAMRLASADQPMAGPAEAMPAPSAPLYRSPEPSLDAPNALEEPAPAEPRAGRLESVQAFMAGLFSRP